MLKLLFWGLVGPACLLADSIARAQPTPQFDLNPPPASLPIDGWPSGVANREQLPSDRAFDYEFDGMQAEQIIGWIEWAGVALPVKVTGQLSGWLWAQRSSEGWLDFGNYRIEGEITSPRLGLDQWFLDSARLRFGFAEGDWYVSNLSGKVFQADVEGSLGRVDAAAIIPTESTQLLQTSGEIAQVDLRRLLSALNIHVGVSGGGGLTFAGSVELGDVTRVESWRATADLQLKQVDLDDAAFPTATLRAQANLAKGRWELADGELSWLDAPIRIAGSGRITGDFPYRLGVQGRNIDTEQLLRDFELPSLADQLSGSVSAEADLSGSVTQGIQAASATIDSNEFVYRGQALRQLDLRASYRPSGIEVRINSAKLAGGQFSGFSRWNGLQQLDQLPSEAEFLLESIQLEELSSELIPVELGGTADGQVTLRSVAAAGADAAARWGMDAVLQIGDFSVAIDRPQDVPATSPQSIELDDTRMLWSKSLESHELQGQLTSADGAIDLKGKLGTRLGDTRLSWNKAADSSKAEVQLTAQSRVESHLLLRLDSVPGEALRHTRLAAYQATGVAKKFALKIPVTSSQSHTSQLPVQFTGDFQFSGNPRQWLERGSAELDALTVRADGQTLRLQTAVVDVSPREFRLRRFRLVTARGRVAGSAIYHRQEDGQHVLNLRAVDQYLSDYLPLVPDFDLPLDGAISLEARLTKTASGANWTSGWQGRFASELTRLTYRDQSLGDLSVAGKLIGEAIAMEANGTLLGGAFSAAARLPFALFMNSVENPLQGAFPLELTGNINGLDVARLAHIAAGPRMAAGLRGFVSAEVEANLIKPEELQWSSQISIPSMSNNGELLARNLSARLSYANESLQIKELSGGIAGGRLEASGPLDLDSLIAGRRAQQSAGLRFDMQRVKVANLLRLAFPDYADPFTGILSYRGTARIARGVLLSGNAHVDDASAYGFPIQRVHGDLRLRLNSDGSLGQLSSQNLNGTVLGGNFAGQFGLRGGAHYELEAQAKVTRGQLPQLSRALGFDHIVGKGRFEGAVGLQSRDAASLAALTGGVQIDFQGGDAQSVPLLADLARYIPLLQLASTEIRTGTLHALIGQGQLRIRDVLLVGDAFWLVGEGNAGLTSGRLDIAAVLETGSGIDQELVQGAVRNLAVVAIPQLALLVELNDLISNRSLYFHIGGTTRHPAIQARAAQTLARGVIQTVRRRLLAAPLSAATAAETLRD